VKALAITMDRRMAALPEVPTLDEAGVRGYQLSVWNGIFTQSRVAAPVLARLQQVFNAAMDAAMLDRLKANFTEPLIISPADLQDWLTRDAERWSTIARESNIRPD
jgi:tripartite-type tricarboxylate transporter receptor subunit TctC